jgi:hypothetical protein
MLMSNASFVEILSKGVQTDLQRQEYRMADQAVAPSIQSVYTENLLISTIHND